MSEHHRRLYPEQVYYLCDQILDNGVTRCNYPTKYTGEMRPTLPPKYAHQCTNGHVTGLAMKYPYIRFVDNRGREVSDGSAH